MSEANKIKLCGAERNTRRRRHDWAYKNKRV